ncbi:MAG: HTTM domain-containing protein [Deltaproteobacteria bacterium]
MSGAIGTSRQVVETFSGRLKTFFFARELPYGMALMRISLPAVLLVDIVRRWPYAREFYSTDGATAPLFENFGYPHFLPFFAAPVAVGLYTALVLFMVASAAGWFTRISMPVATALYFYFTMLDCLSTISKYTVMATHLLLLLSLSNCGDLWSVDSWLRRRRLRREFPGAPLPAVRGPVWPQRLAQILIGMIYFGAAITKLHTPEFFSGDQLVSWMMTYINNEHPLGDYLLQYPLLVSVSCYITFFWELTFIFLVWGRKMRWWLLAVGTAFHLMTWLTLGLIIFPLVVSAAYMVFLQERDVRAICTWRFLRRLFPGLSVPPAAAVDEPPAVNWRGRFGSIGAFAMVMALLCLAGIEAEHLTDHYHMRGPGGPLPLREMTDEELQPLFAPDRPIRQSDKLLAFDLGSLLVGEHLVHTRKEFRQGEQLVAQVTLNKPRDDMWVDCLLCEAARDDSSEETRLVPGRIVAKIGLPMYRESFRGNFIFNLDEALDPGDYFLRLRSGAEEVSRRHFRVLPRAGVAAPAAN